MKWFLQLVKLDITNFLAISTVIHAWNVPQVRENLLIESLHNFINCTLHSTVFFEHVFQNLSI